MRLFFNLMNFVLPRQPSVPFALSPEPVEGVKGQPVANTVVRRAHHERSKVLSMAGVIAGSLSAAVASAQQAPISAASASGMAAKFADPATVTALPTSGVSSMGQVTLALMVVLIAVFAAAWTMRRFKNFNRTGQALEIVQGINLGPKERAVLVKVQNRCVLIGVAPGCVNLLLELDAIENSDADKSSDEPSAPTDINTPNFKALLKRSMGLS